MHRQKFNYKSLSLQIIECISVLKFRKKMIQSDYIILHVFLNHVEELILKSPERILGMEGFLSLYDSSPCSYRETCCIVTNKTKQ